MTMKKKSISAVALFFILCFPYPAPFEITSLDILGVCAVALTIIRFITVREKSDTASLFLICYILVNSIFHANNILFGIGSAGFLGTIRCFIPFCIGKFISIELKSIVKASIWCLILNIVLGVAQKNLGFDLVKILWSENFGNAKTSLIATGIFGNYSNYSLGISILLLVIVSKSLVQGLGAVVISVYSFFLAPLATYPFSAVSAISFGLIPKLSEKLTKENLLRFICFCFIVISSFIFIQDFLPAKLLSIFNLSFLDESLRSTASISFFTRIETTFVENIDLFKSDYILGVGFGYAKDSLWLSLLATSGLIGTAFFLAALLEIWSRVRSNKVLRLIFDRLFIFILISGVFHYPLLSGYSSQILWFLLGLFYFNSATIKPLKASRWSFLLSIGQHK